MILLSLATNKKKMDTWIIKNNYCDGIMRVIPTDFQDSTHWIRDEKKDNFIKILTRL